MEQAAELLGVSRPSVVRAKKRMKDDPKEHVEGSNDPSTTDAISIEQAAALLSVSPPSVKRAKWSVERRLETAMLQNQMDQMILLFQGRLASNKLPPCGRLLRRNWRRWLTGARKKQYQMILFPRSA